MTRQNTVALAPAPVATSCRRSDKRQLAEERETDKRSKEDAGSERGEGAGDRERGARDAEKVGKEAVPEIIWRKREEEGQAERKGAQASQRAHETVWRKRERE